MIKHRVTIGRDLLGLVATAKAAAARHIATRIKAEFNALLMSTPQYSGNYTANMRISVGPRKTTSEVIRPYKKYPKSLKSKGVTAPIERARKNSDLDTLEERFVSHAMGVPVWSPQMLVYNNLREAEYIEGMPEDRLRSANKPEGVMAMDKFKIAVEKIDVLISVKVT